VGYGSPSAGSDDEVGYGSRTWIVEQQRKVKGNHHRAAARLILEIDVGERLSVVIADNEAGVLLLDRPRRRKAAACSLGRRKRKVQAVA
jgi:hypothetical protein